MLTIKIDEKKIDCGNYHFTRLPDDFWTDAIDDVYTTAEVIEIVNRTLTAQLAKLK